MASVTGEVIDMACYFDDGASGPGHAECARMCIASGLPVILYSVIPLNCSLIILEFRMAVSDQQEPASNSRAKVSRLRSNHGSN